MKTLIFIFISTCIKKKYTKLNYFFSDSVNINFNNSYNNLDKPLSECDCLTRATNSGLNLKEIENKTEVLLENERIYTIFYKNTLLQKLLSNISIFEKEKLVEEHNILSNTVTNITAGGLLDDWEFPAF